MKVLFFAALREQLGTAQLNWVQPVASLTELKAQLMAQGEVWQILAAEHVQVAVNQRMVRGDCALSEQDEVAFFPPVTGG